jgi:hypothetical protein
MLLFDSVSLEPRWKTYRPGIEVLLRPLTRESLRDLRQKALADPGADVDRLVLVHCVADWNGIVDATGAKVPAGPETIPAVMDAFLHLADWVITQAMTLAETVAAERADALKN